MKYIIKYFCLQYIIQMQDPQLLQNQRSKPLKIKIKKRRRSHRKLRIFGRRTSNKSKGHIKSQQCGKIIQEKTCQICGNKEKDQLMVLCDQCDDAYHWPCLGLQQSQIAVEIWRCPNCVQFRENVKNYDQNLPDECFKCHKKMDQIPKLKYMCAGQIKQIQINKPQFIECLKCKNHFHSDCFSMRKNSINCWTCELKIRREGPRNHEQHLSFLKNQLVLVHSKGYFQLARGDETPKTKKRAINMGFKLFQELTDWQLITRHQASLYYALKSRDLIFTDEQVYSSQQIMALNNSQKQIVQVHPLHIDDQRMYEFFKAKIRRGAVLPLEIKEDRLMGFYINALAYIQKGTILCEYTGEVISLRESLGEERHDSIFTLLITGSSKGDLNIVPKVFGNMSRFICGINNKQKDHLKRVNVASVRFSHQNRMRVVFIAKRSIEMGQTLYLDYNAGTYEEYPTYNFV